MSGYRNSEKKSSNPVLDRGSLKIKSGKFGSGAIDPHWHLNDGTGDRAFIQHIDFGEDLSEAPAIVLAFTYLECDFKPVRVAVEPKNINIRGFDVEIRTWSDSHVSSCGGFWTAYAS
jgi:hypothetical protein